jgi:prepilin-type N-terminal cleavage/methylation domain-containing protein
MMKNTRHSRRTGRAAFTLAELMVAISIFAFATLASSSLMFATYNTNRSIRGTATASEQGEVAFRRVVEYIRSAVAIGYNSTGGLMIQTPKNPNAGNLAYVVTYYQQYATTSAGPQLQLREMVQRADTMAIIQDVPIVDDLIAFSVARQGASLPQLWRVSITVDGAPRVSRTSLVTGRSLLQ